MLNGYAYWRLLINRLLEKKAIIVTGAASGIGAAVARASAMQGANTVLADISADRCHAIAEEIEMASGTKTLVVGVDVTKEASVRRMIRSGVAAFGELNGAVNCAGIVGAECAIETADAENFDSIMNCNVKGVFLSLKYEVEHMLLTGRGTIVNISSDVGLKGYALRPAYSASKHAVIGLTRSVAIGVAAKGIRVNVVCPGSTKTPMSSIVNKNSRAIIEKQESNIPMQRRAEASEIAEAVIWLLSDSSSFVTGAVIPVDGGGSAK